MKATGCAQCFSPQARALCSSKWSGPQANAAQVCRAAPDPVLDAVLLHCLNHVADSAARIKHNNEAAKADAEGDELRDQGFVRAKVCLLSAESVEMYALEQGTVFEVRTVQIRPCDGAVTLLDMP